MRHVFPALLLIALPIGSLLHAEDEPRLNHFRVGVQSLPTDLEVKTSGFGGSIEDSVNADSAGRLSLGYWYGGAEEVSFLIGGGLDFSSFTFEENDETTKIKQFGVFIEPGVAVRVAPWFSAEGGIRFGVGGVQTETTVAGIDIDDTAYGEISLRLRGVFTVSRGLELVVETGYLYQQFTYEFEILNETIEQEVTVDGLFGGVALGWKF